MNKLSTLKSIICKKLYDNFLYKKKHFPLIYNLIGLFLLTVAKCTMCMQAQKVIRCIVIKSTHDDRL